MTLTTDLTTTFRAARNVSTPLIAIWTADPAALMDGLLKTLPKGAPAMQWDFVRGLRGLNTEGAAQVQQLLGNDDPADASANPDDALKLLQKAAKGACIFMQNGTRFWDTPAVAQAIWNLRNPFKASQRTLVILGPDGKVPKELEHDVVVLTEPLPGRDELEKIITDLHTAASVPMPEASRLNRIIDATAGLSAFAAEQIVAMSLTKSGVDLARLRDRRRQAIENTEGLSVWKGDQTFDDLGGHEQIKAFARRLRDTSREPIKAIAFFDEMDKEMAGSGANGQQGDTSGTSQYQHKAVLVHMQDRGAKGMMLYGLSGTGKTEFVKCLAGELDCEMLMVDLGGMQGSLVGESQARTNAALKVIDAVGQGNTLFVATCNGTSTISPELRSRFRTYGEWYFDSPTADELQTIVKIYLTKWDLKVTAENPLPNMAGWTGREVRSCLYLAYNLGMTFTEAATFVVPMHVSSPEVVTRIRQNASGRFLSSAKKGFYQMPAEDETPAEAPTTARRFSLEDAPLAVATMIATRNQKGN